MYADAALRAVRDGLKAAGLLEQPYREAVRELWRRRADLRPACDCVAVYHHWMPPQTEVEKRLYPMRGEQQS